MLSLVLLPTLHIHWHFILIVEILCTIVNLICDRI